MSGVVMIIISFDDDDNSWHNKSMELWDDGFERVAKLCSESLIFWCHMAWQNFMSSGSGFDL